MKLQAILTAGVMALALNATAQEPAASSPEIDKALLAAPANLRAEATVIKWKSDFTYDTLKKGTGKLVCYDRSGQPGQQPFSIECTSLANLDRVAQNMKFEAAGDKAKTQAMLDEAEKNGTRVKPEYGSLFFNFMGASEAQARRHTTVSVPGATSSTTGLPDKRDAGGAWIMGAGTTSAHIMLPGS